MDFTVFAENPLSPTTLRALRYAATVESGTMGHLRNVLVTATHKDARVTAFLGTWAFEKFWIADALQHVVDAHEGVELPQPKRQSRIVAFVKEVRERVRPISGSITANRIGEDMIAVHMVMGTIDEWLTTTALERIAELEGNEHLTAIVATLVGVKTRQLEFFEAQSRDRLARGETTQSVVRSQLADARWPIGAQDSPASETAFYYQTLFATSPAAVADIEARIATLPGQKGLTPITRAVSAAKGARS
jgi:hypothetical protein